MRKGDDPRGQIQAKINNFWCFLKKTKMLLILSIRLMLPPFAV